MAVLHSAPVNMIYKILLLQLVGLILCEDNPSVLLKIEARGSMWTCEDTKATVLVGKPVEIHVKHNVYIYKITCKHKLNQEIKTVLGQTFLRLDIVFPYLGSNWTCTIVTSPRTLYPPSQRTEKCNGNTCAAIDCHIQMHVRREEALQVILVNNMVLKSTRAALYEPHDALAEYTFNDGDLVDVTCANAITAPKWQICYLHMFYGFFNQYSNLTYNGENKQRTPLNSIGRYMGKVYDGPVGFKLRMRPANDNTHAVCTCELWSHEVRHDTGTVRINFHMRNDPNVDTINVYINGAALRPTTDERGEYEYQYIPDDSLNVTCESVPLDNSLRFEWISKPISEYIYNESSSDWEGAIFRLPSLKKQPSLQCVTHKSKIKVTLKPKELVEAKDKCPLRVWLENSNNITIKPVLELYQAGKRDYIYEYKDADTFKITCQASCDEDGLNMYVAVSGGKTKESHSRLISDKKLISIPRIKTAQAIKKDNVIECRILDKSSIVRVIRTLIFVHVPTNTKTTIAHVPTKTKTTIAHVPTKTKTTIAHVPTKTKTTIAHVPTNPTTTEDTATTPAASDKQQGSWATVIGVIALCVLLLAVIIVIYRKKIRKSNSSNSPWEYQLHENVNTAPAPERCDPIIEDELYTLPVTKDKRKPNLQIDPTYEDIGTKVTNDITYAELMHSGGDSEEARAKVATRTNKSFDDNAHYAEIMVHDDSGKYANVHELLYVNANMGCEYAEPS